MAQKKAALKASTTAATVIAARTQSTTVFRSYVMHEGKLVPHKVLTTDNEIATEYRKQAASLCDDGEELAPMDDKQVVAIARSIHGDGMETDMKRWTAIYEAEPAQLAGNGEEPSDVPNSVKFSAVKGSALAFEIGGKLDKETVGHFEELADAKQTFDGSPFYIADDFSRLFGSKREDGTMDLSTIINLPRPGTWSVTAAGKSTKKKIVTGNVQPDHYKITPVGGGDPIVGSFYGDILLGTDPGHAYSETRRLLRAMDKGRTALAEGDKKLLRKLVSDPDMSDLLDAAIDTGSEHAIDQIGKWNLTRFNNKANKLRSAVLWLQQRDDIEALPGMMVQVAGALKTAAKLRNPITIYYDYVDKDGRKQRAHSSALTLGQFTRYDVDKAKSIATSRKVGVSPGLLAETVKKARKQDTNTPGKDAPAIGNIHTFKSYLYEVASYGADGKRYESILAACNGEEGDDLILALWQISDFIDGIMPQFSNRATVLLAKQAAKRDAEAAGEAAAIEAKKAEHHKKVFPAAANA